MENFYQQIVKFVSSIPNLWYMTIVLGLVALALMMFIKFYKTHDVVEKKAGNIYYVLLAVVFMAILILFISLRK